MPGDSSACICCRVIPRHIPHFAGQPLGRRPRWQPGDRWMCDVARALRCTGGSPRRGGLVDPGGPATNLHIHNHIHGHTDHPIKTKRLRPETDTLTPCHQTSRRTSTPWRRQTSTRESEMLRVGHTVKTHSSHRYIAPPLDATTPLLNGGNKSRPTKLLIMIACGSP